MFEERICVHCGEPLEPGTPADFNFATGEGWHPECKKMADHGVGPEDLSGHGYPPQGY